MQPLYQDLPVINSESVNEFSPRSRFPSPPNEQLNLTLYPGPRLACAKPQTRVKRKLTRC